MMKLPDFLEGYTILNFLKETDKAYFYLCCNDLDEKFLLKIYKKEKKCTSPLLTTIKHPNAVTVVKQGFLFDSDSNTKKSYEILTYYESAKTLAETAPLKESEVFEIIRKITECINEFHKKGFIHRNITPQNILISENEPVLISYGCVTKIVLDYDLNEARTKIFKQAQDITGTQGYIPPESYTGILTTATDFFCIGMTLYFLLTGQSLCADKNAEQYKKLLLSGDLIYEVNKTSSLTVRQKKIICGLITHQSERWGFNEVMQFINDGAEIPIYKDWEPFGPVLFRNKKYCNLKLLSEALLYHPKAGSRFIKKGLLKKYLLQLNLSGKAQEINKQLEINRSYSPEQICAIAYLIINDFKYEICENLTLCTKDDFLSLNEQLKKKVELLILSKDTTFCLWLSHLFNANLEDFYSQLNGDYDFEKSIAINKKQKKEGLWTVLVEFLIDNKITVEPEQLESSIYSTHLKKIIKRTNCDSFIQTGNLFLAKRNNRYAVYNFIDGKKVLSQTFLSYKTFPYGCFLYDKEHSYFVIQKGRKPSVKEMFQTFEHFLNVPDYNSLNQFISITFEHSYENKYFEMQKKILSYIDCNHLEELTPLTELYYLLFSFSNYEFDSSTFIRKLEDLCNKIQKNIQKISAKDAYSVIYRIGKIFEEFGMQDDAIKYYEKCRKYASDKNCSDKRRINEIAIAAILEEQGKHKEAMKYFKLCFEEYPELKYQNSKYFELYNNCCAALGL